MVYYCLFWLVKVKVIFGVWVVCLMSVCGRVFGVGLVMLLLVKFFSWFVNFFGLVR